jgi:RES domain-containing protein
VYLASSPASALLEALVHELSLDELPESYQWLEVGVEDGVQVTPPPELPSGWQHEISKTRAVGDAWLRDTATPLLEVPSVIVPKTANYLLNPRHPKAHDVRITSVIRYPLDLRFAGPV